MKSDQNITRVKLQFCKGIDMNGLVVMRHRCIQSLRSMLNFSVEGFRKNVMIQFLYCALSRIWPDLELNTCGNIASSFDMLAFRLSSHEDTSLLHPSSVESGSQQEIELHRICVHNDQYVQ